jgi:hypothetical protein
VTVTLGTNTATKIAGGVSGVENINGGKGNDSLTDDSHNDIIRGVGNDTIVGGGNDILIGGQGAANISAAGSGRSILIGGKLTAAQTLTGSTQDDIFIGGYTSYDSYSLANDQALMAILAEWTSADSVATRTIVVKATDTTGKTLDVTIDKTDYGTFQPTGHLFVYGQGGKDKITLNSYVAGKTNYYIKIPAFLYGEGSGGDSISAANNVLSGHGKDEGLIGGHGRDLLIGDTGAAALKATKDDILIGGWTNYDISSSGMTYDQKLAALDAIMAEWGSADS